MGAVLKTYADSDDLGHWCPGCQRVHILPWKRGGWTFDGNMTSPTFSPSFKHEWNEWDGAAKVHRVCHYVLTAGVLNFCGDSTHSLRGAVPMPPLPDRPESA